jgi:hypothetical protein
MLQQLNNQKKAVPVIKLHHQLVNLLNVEVARKPKPRK